MKLILLFAVALALTSCQVKDCKFNPTVEISKKSDKEDTEKNSSKNKLSVKKIKENANPGGQFVCRY